jgi:hypothetical protein
MMNQSLTLAPSEKSVAFLKKYKIVFTDLIVDSVSIFQVPNEDRFFLTVFTIDGQIKQLEFDNLNSPTISSGSFNKNLDIICVEYLSLYGSKFFALGSAQGSVYVISLENVEGKGLLRYDIIDEVKRPAANLSEKITSMIPFNLNVFSKQTSPDSVLAIKFLGNNLFAFVTEQFNFRVYNFKKKKEVYSNCLIKNRTDQRLMRSKINFLTLELDNNTREYRSKPFTFTIYIEYDLINVIQSFELIFANIPDLPSQNIEDMMKLDQSFYETVDLGQDIRIKNTRSYKLNGSIVDMISYNNKIWVLSENAGFYSDDQNDNELEKYQMKIFSLDLGTKSSQDETIIYLDSRLKNAYNVFNQIKLNKNYSLLGCDFSGQTGGSKTENELLYLFLDNEEYVPEDILLSFCNKCIIDQQGNKKVFNNKSQVISYLQKESRGSTSYLEDFIEKLLKESLNNEILCLGSLTNREIDGLTFVRRQGISLIKKMSEFGSINNVINHHEFILRNLIFGFLNLPDYQTHNNDHLSELKSKIFNYITLESKSNQENILYVILALCRIYLTENNLFLNDEEYLLNYFKRQEDCDDHILSNLLRDHFLENLSNQFSNLAFLDTFHHVINNVYLNNRSYIDAQIQNLILNRYDEYKLYRRDRTIQLFKRENINLLGEKFNSKFVDIISKLVDDKINSFYFIARDLVSFNYWVKIYYNKNVDKKFTENNTVLTNRVENMFVETSSCYILSSNTLKLKDNTHLNNIEPSYSMLAFTQDINCTYKDFILYENLRTFGSDLIYSIKDEYIDYIVLTIWSDLQYEESKINEHLNELQTYTQLIINDPNRRRRYETFHKLFSMKEYKLISLLLKLQRANNLESVFLDILCQAFISDRESLFKMKELLNKYFSMFIDISNHLDQLGEKSFKLFEDFYVNFFNKENKITWNEPGLLSNVKFSNIHLIISGYYYLEEQLKNILSDSAKYEFYFNCYTFIYPTLAGLDYFKFQSSTKESTGVKKILEFLINMLRSCIDVDIDLALSFYSAAKENFEKLDSIREVVDIFVDYCVRCHDWSSFINKLYFAERELVEKICIVLEKKCNDVENDNNSMFNILKSSLKLTGENLISEYKISNLSDDASNYFLILSAIYIELGDFQKAAQISFSYSEEINKLIEGHLWNIIDLKKIYKERREAISIVIHCIERIEGVSTSPMFIIKDHNSDNQDKPTSNLKFVTIKDLQNSNLLTKLRMLILIRLESDVGQVHPNFKIEEINRIKNPNVMLNYLFILNLHNIILEENLVSRNLFEDSTLKKLIINFIRVHLMSNLELSNKMQVDEEDKLLKNKIYDVSSFNPSDYRLIQFYEQIVESGNTMSLFVALETILFANKNLDLPQILISEAKTRNPLKLMELFIKYSRVDVKKIKKFLILLF